MCLAGVGGCASAPSPETTEPQGISITGMLIRNVLPYAVTDTMISVPATGAFAGCGNLMPNSDCRTSFQVVDYSGHPLLFSWKERGQEHSTGEVTLEPGPEIVPYRPVWLEVTIYAPGQAGARFIRSPD